MSSEITAQAAVRQFGVRGLRVRLMLGLMLPALLLSALVPAAGVPLTLLGLLIALVVPAQVRSALSRLNMAPDTACAVRVQGPAGLGSFGLIPDGVAILTAEALVWTPLNGNVLRRRQIRLAGASVRTPRFPMLPGLRALHIENAEDSLTLYVGERDQWVSRIEVLQAEGGVIPWLQTSPEPPSDPASVSERAPESAQVPASVFAPVPTADSTAVTTPVTTPVPALAVPPVPMPAPVSMQRTSRDAAPLEAFPDAPAAAAALSLQCRACSTQLPDHARYCWQCGASQFDEPALASEPGSAAAPEAPIASLSETSTAPVLDEPIASAPDVQASRSDAPLVEDLETVAAPSADRPALPPATKVDDLGAVPGSALKPTVTAESLVDRATARLTDLETRSSQLTAETLERIRKTVELTAWVDTDLDQVERVLRAPSADGPVPASLEPKGKAGKRRKAKA